MNTQHTPGSWSISEHNGRRTIQAPCDYPPKDGVAFVIEIAKCSMVNDEANAKLIAAAPELLEALKAIVVRLTRSDQLSTSKNKQVCNALRCDCFESANIARAAIQKATNA